MSYDAVHLLRGRGLKAAAAGRAAGVAPGRAAPRRATDRGTFGSAAGRGGACGRLALAASHRAHRAAPMPVTPLPAEHPLRRPLADELHARPPTPVRSPAVVSCLALLDAPAGEVLATLREVLGEPPSDAGEVAHIIFERPQLRLKWERHGEFVSLTLVRPLAESSLAAFDRFPECIQRAAGGAAGTAAGPADRRRRHPAAARGGQRGRRRRAGTLVRPRRARRLAHPRRAGQRVHRFRRAQRGRGRRPLALAGARRRDERAADGAAGAAGDRDRGLPDDGAARLSLARAPCRN